MASAPLVVGIGELLWDKFPAGDQVGGAPANFAFHASQLGADGKLVSRVGDDPDGHVLVAALAGRTQDTRFIQRDPTAPTGTVHVALQAGQPTYTITESVAWDRLEWTEALADLAQRCAVVSFGSLAQRAPTSRATIQQFVAATPAAAIRLFDINLRQHFFDKPTLEWGLAHATVLKLNEHEVGTLAKLFDLPADPDALAPQLFKRFPLNLIALTLGAQGCALFSGNQSARAPAPPVTVVDAVGAGDAFAAALTLGLLRDRSLPELAAHANAVGAFVASQPGATPALPNALTHWNAA